MVGARSCVLCQGYRVKTLSMFYVQEWEKPHVLGWRAAPCVFWMSDGHETHMVFSKPQVQLGSLGRCLPVSSSWVPFVSSCLGGKESPEGAMFQLSEEVDTSSLR